MACINLGSVPGGADSFALAAKFCYGIDVELTPSNVAGLHCVSEYLEMTEHLEEGNVSSKAEAYLNSVVLNSWHDSMLVLTSCEHLLPWAEDLQIIQRCSQSLARKACIPKGSSAAWWYEEVSCLTLHCFEKVMNAMARNLMDPNLMGGALEHYGHKWLPGVFKQSAENSPKTSSPNTPAGSRLESPTGDRSPVHEFSQESKLHDVIVEQNKNRYIIERIATMVPQQRDAVGCRFLLRLLRAANMFNCSVECRAELEKKAGLQLDQASLSDLLIPSFSHTSEYLYDVDLVSRLLDHFLSQVCPFPTSRTKPVHDLGCTLTDIHTPHDVPGARTGSGAEKQQILQQEDLRSTLRGQRGLETEPSAGERAVQDGSEAFGFLSR